MSQFLIDRAAFLARPAAHSRVRENQLIARLRLQKISERLGGGKIHLAVQKRALGELPRARRASARRKQRGQYRFGQQNSTVTADFRGNGRQDGREMPRDL